MSVPESTLRIAPAAETKAGEAIRLLFSRLPAQQRDQQVAMLLGAIRRGEVSLSGLWTATRNRGLVGSGFAQLQPGRTALVWIPRIIASEPPATATALMAAVDRMLGEAGVVMANALLAEVDDHDRTLLGSAGYRFLAQLDYLMSVRNVFPQQEPRTPLVFEPYCVENHRRLAEVVEATYEKTCDCPALDGVRNIEDALVGYRTTGEFDPARWLIVRHESRDIGCLLLADHPGQDSWELVYMGVVAAARGRGWGQHIVRHAQWLAGQAGRSSLVLAVDDGNGPALEVYASLGFHQWDERAVYVRIFGDSA